MCLLKFKHWKTTADAISPRNSELTQMKYAVMRQVGQILFIQDVLKEIPERFRHSSWTEEMAVEVVKEMTDEYEYWNGDHGAHMVRVKPGCWEGIDYTSKKHDPILRAQQVAMAEHCPNDNDVQQLTTLKEMVDAVKLKWTYA
jgi:hypothetical protein